MPCTMFDCGLMILAKREFNKLKDRVCCGMLSTVDEFFIFVWNGTLPVFLSIKVDWSGFSLSPFKFLRSGEFYRNTTNKWSSLCACVSSVTNHETILLSGVLPGANPIFRFLVLCHSLYFWCQIIQWLEKSLLDIHLLVPVRQSSETQQDATERTLRRRDCGTDELQMRRNSKKWNMVRVRR